MIGEQHHYEAKVFLSHYRDALNTLEYLLPYPAKSHKTGLMWNDSKLSRILSLRVPNEDRYL